MPAYSAPLARVPPCSETATSNHHNDVRAMNQKRGTLAALGTRLAGRATPETVRCSASVSTESPTGPVSGDIIKLQHQLIEPSLVQFSALKTWIYRVSGQASFIDHNKLVSQACCDSSVGEAWTKEPSLLGMRVPFSFPRELHSV
ncbi:hypothetical protein RRG08_045210 [Elysia crispata]|uniref:Uncharacterized protein n=1 Tax=Elysia crispata TaxID=231223 RepID=A0AAE1A1E2_9GAST|nr:hypothetical protein RRG08_045210 [Elysia crispata]